MYIHDQAPRAAPREYDACPRALPCVLPTCFRSFVACHRAARMQCGTRSIRQLNQLKKQQHIAPDIPMPVRFASDQSRVAWHESLAYEPRYLDVRPSVHYRASRLQSISAERRKYRSHIPTTYVVRAWSLTALAASMRCSKVFSASATFCSLQMVSNSRLGREEAEGLVSASRTGRTATSDARTCTFCESCSMNCWRI